ncbi:MAG: hypothetical protein FWH04_07320 [Oscillospiraceae bacterium]|nr:hypothetical protein [Oscillospiraceae bacterium]
MPSRGDLPSWEDFGKLADETDVLSDVLNAIGNVLKWIPPDCALGLTLSPGDGVIMDKCPAHKANVIFDPIYKIGSKTKIK